MAVAVNRYLERVSERRGYEGGAAGKVTPINSGLSYGEHFPYRELRAG
jgi:hypothetical protein